MCHGAAARHEIPQPEHIQRWTMRALGFLSDHHLEKAERLVAGFVDGIRCTKSQSATLRLIGYTVAEWCLIAACYASVLKAFGSAASLSPIGILVLMGFVSFGSLIQLPAVGGGAQVTAVLVLTEIFGTPLEAAGTGVGAGALGDFCSRQSCRWARRWRGARG